MAKLVASTTANVMMPTKGKTDQCLFIRVKLNTEGVPNFLIVAFIVKCQCPETKV